MYCTVLINMYTHTYTVELQNDWLLNGGFPRMPVAEIVGFNVWKGPRKKRYLECP